MNTGPASLLLPLGGCLAAFLMLACRPSFLPSAQSLPARLGTALRSFAGVPAAVILTSTLIWFLWFRLSCGSLPLAACGVLILLTAAGISLLPIAFPARLPDGPSLLETGARLVIGLACAACWLHAGDETSPHVILVVGAVASLLPDALDHWVARVLRRIDIHIVPDPLAPDPGLMASALAQAVSRCHLEQRALHLELYPGRNQTGDGLRYLIEMCNPAARVTVSHGNDSASSRLAVPVTSHHSFTQETGEDSLSLDLIPAADGRVRIAPDSWRSGWSHSLLAALVAGLLAGVIWGFGAGMTALLAWSLHGLLDQAGYGGTAWAFPLIRHHTAGFQYWRPAQARALNLGVLWLGLLITSWSLARIALPGSVAVNPVALLVVAGIIPLVTIRALSGSKS